MTIRILTVCLGNICRSPAAEAAIRQAAAEAGLDVEVDSAGTADYHIGKPADPRMLAAAERAGLTLTSAARQVAEEDFHTFDLILAMDRSNLRELQRRAPEGSRARIALLSDLTDRPGTEVPDPYHGEDEGFAEVVATVRQAASQVVAALAEGRLAVS